jgi:exosortase
VISALKNLPRSALLAALALACLWLRLINHLRIEWTVNEQYAYGWAVPFLCVYLLGRRWKSGDKNQKSEIKGQAATGRLTSDLRPLTSRPRSAPTVLLLLALAFIFIRWIEEANPDWRLMSWALALEVIAFTLVLTYAIGGAARLRQLAFPVLFFLVAVPWPTPVEQPLIQVLTRGIVAVTVEMLHAFGVAAVPHGNVIETAGGLVDIDEACSGIRSLQAVLMLALFLGELRRFNLRRRVVLCLVAFVLACLFNLARTVTLSMVAARRGAEAVHAWHDPAGIAILVGCFIGVWAVAAWMGRGKRGDRETGRQGDKEIEKLGEKETVLPVALSPGFLVALIMLLLAGELGIHLWYSSAPRIATADWRVEMPQTNPTFKPAELPKAAVQILRFNEGRSGIWQNPDGTRWQMIYLRWNPGRTAVHLARNHTPEICLPAAGKNLRGISEVNDLQADGIRLPFRCFTTGSENKPLHVFYSLWEDGVREQRVATQLLTRQSRWKAVLERRRNPGQRVLQIAIWGARDAAQAEELLRAELPKFVVQNVENLKR